MIPLVSICLQLYKPWFPVLKGFLTLNNTHGDMNWVVQKKGNTFGKTILQVIIIIAHICTVLSNFNSLIGFINNPGR